MKIIIAGDGKVGSTLTRELAAEGYDVTIIDANPKVLEATEERYDVLSIQGNCASMDVLDQAGVREADLLIVATSADEINLLCSLTAHCMNKDIHTIARIRNPEYTNQLVRMRDAFALSMTVNPELQAAVEIERLIKYPGFLKRDTFAKGRVEIVELRVIKESPLCDLCLNDLEQVVKCQVLVCTVLRRGEAVAPDGNFVLREGDRIFVTAPSENLTILLKNLGIITHKARRIMICGGGRISYYLAKRLEKSGIDVRIVTPHVPDKWYVHMVTRSYYKQLLEAGVKIYEYTPGFIHAKNFVVDDRFAVVGTVNLDYRSLFLHFEDGVWLCEAPCIHDIRADFEETLKVCERISLRKHRRLNPLVQLYRNILRVFAPLM